MTNLSPRLGTINVRLPIDKQRNKSQELKTETLKTEEQYGTLVKTNIENMVEKYIRTEIVSVR